MIPRSEIAVGVQRRAVLCSFRMLVAHRAIDQRTDWCLVYRRKTQYSAKGGMGPTPVDGSFAAHSYS